MEIWGWKERGANGSQVRFDMAGNNTKSHISEFPVGTYKKAHRHGPGAHLVILSGKGFSLLWSKEDMSDVEKVDWAKDGMVIIPQDDCFHQHCNSGTTRARYLALLPGKVGLTIPVQHGKAGTDVSIKEGGIQVEYEDEAPLVHEIFEVELKKNGATCLMKAFIPTCTGEVGPTDARLT